MAAAAATRTTRAAPGTYGTFEPGRTMLGTCPMSSVELTPSYRASQPAASAAAPSGEYGTIRGAAAATAGSAKCGSSGSSQPGAGTQSESRNATSGVSTAASPVFRAAAGPPLTARRTTWAPAAVAAAATAAGSREPSSTTITRYSVRPARHRASSAVRSRTGMTTVTSPGPGPPAGTGCAIPIHSSRRASACAPGAAATGAPCHQPATCRVPAGPSRSIRSGDPPSRMVPPRSVRSPGSGRSRSPSVARPGAAAFVIGVTIGSMTSEGTGSAKGAGPAGAAAFDAGQPYEKHPQVAIRPESFGALAYHYGNRRLVFLKAPALVTVVETLGDFPSAAAAVAAHVPDAQRETYCKALSGLLASDVIRAR